MSIYLYNSLSLYTYICMYIYIYICIYIHIWRETEREREIRSSLSACYSSRFLLTPRAAGKICVSPLAPRKCPKIRGPKEGGLNIGQHEGLNM